MDQNDFSCFKFSRNLPHWKDILKIHANKFKMFSDMNLMTFKGMLSALLLSFGLKVEITLFIS